MNLLASALAKQGKMEEAERLFQEAISIRKSEGNEGRLASAVTALANFYIAQKQPERAEQLFSDTLAEREKGLGSDNAALSVFVMSMADCYTSLGKYDQAETLLKRAIAIREKSLGPEHVDVAESLSKLGDFYERLGRYVEAEAIYSRSLAIREKALAPGDMLIADSLKELAWDHHRLFQDKIGMPLIDRAIRIYQDQRRIHESAFAWVLNTKAALSGHLEDHVAAIENYEKAIELLKRDRERYGIILNNIANSYVALGRYAEAETAYRQSRAEALQDVQEAKESVTETIHSYGRLVLTTGNLARHLQTIGKREEALQLLEEALPIAEQNLSPDHPFLEDVLTCLANHYQGDLQLERAEALREQSLKIMEKVFGNAHVSYGWSLCALGELRKRQGRIDDAEAFFHQAKPILLKGDDHNDDQSYMREAEAELDILRGKLADAKDDLKEALSLREKKLGNSHPRLIGVLLSLTDIAILQGDLSYAEETLNRCRAITTTVFGEESIQMASVLERQMKIARFQGKLDESLELSRREVELTIRTYGEMHPQTDLARVRQADILLEAGKITEAEELARRALTVLAERLPAKHHLLADAELVVGKALLAGSKLDGAKEAVERAVTLRTAVFGADNYHIAEAGAVLGRIEVAAKDHSALSSLSRAYEVQLKSLGVGSSQTLQTMVDLGEVLLAENKLNQSQQFCASALPKLKSSMGRDHALSRRAARCLATAYRADQKEQLALQLEREFMLTMAP
jgi:pentatricopeptide repeat protein